MATRLALTANPASPRRTCREVLYEEGPNGPVATGLRMTKAGQEQIVKADAYVAALDVPGAQRLVPQVRQWRRRSVGAAEVVLAPLPCDTY